MLVRQWRFSCMVTLGPFTHTRAVEITVVQHIHRESVLYGLALGGAEHRWRLVATNNPAYYAAHATS